MRTKTRTRPIASGIDNIIIPSIKSQFQKRKQKISSTYQLRTKMRTRPIASGIDHKIIPTTKQFLKRKQKIPSTKIFIRKKRTHPLASGIDHKIKLAIKTQFPITKQKYQVHTY